MAPKPRASEAKKYAERKTREHARQRRQSLAGREIGPIPKCKRPQRRRTCRRNLRLFCETYFPARFNKPWSPDHLEVLTTLQDVIIRGGQFALAMPRGSGKTTLATCAVLFAVLYGHRRFVVFLGSTAKAAQQKLDELIREEIETNPLLHEDFPEATHPVRCLERNTTRAKMQLLNGKSTRLSWGADGLRFAMVPKSDCAGARIVCAGLATGDIRGLLKAGIAGGLDRPDLVIGDDLQTDESSRSPLQCDTREAVLNGAVLELAGPGKKIACVCPMTVIRPRDLSDRMLDRQRSPEWQGRKYRLLNSMPKDLNPWHRYADLLREGLVKDPPDRSRATEFYQDNRAVMDRGAEAAWPERFGPDQVSAIQYAMDLFLLKPSVFWAEYQNDPKPDDPNNEAESLDAAELAQRLSQLDQGVVPASCTRLTAFIDPKQEILYATVAAWDEKFGGQVIGYPTYPRQDASQFSGTDPIRPLSIVHAGMSTEARLFAGLTALASEVLGRTYKRADAGEPMKVDKCLVDAGWGPMAETIHEWCRKNPFGPIVIASVGKYVGAAKTPFSEWSTRPGDITGTGWRIRPAGGRHGKFVLFDTNLWKSFAAERLRSPRGTPGAVDLFGANPLAHKLFCDHLTAEHPVRVKADSRVVDEWQDNPGRPDNDWWDCFVGCCVAASVLGLKFSGGVAAGGTVPEAKPRRKLSDIIAGKVDGPTPPPVQTSAPVPTKPAKRKLSDIINRKAGAS